MQATFYFNKTYLYVSDQHHLIDYQSIPYLSVPFQVYEDEKAVIPCRPTNPEVTMTFIKKGYLDITHNLTDYQFKYDPKVGLIVMKGSIRLHSGQITCMASMNGFSQNASFSLNIYRKPKYDMVQKPLIMTDNKYPVHDHMIEFKCFRHIEVERYHLVDFEWHFGNFTDTSRIDVSDLNIGEGPSKALVTLDKRLTIKPLKKSDENATFSCNMVQKKERSSNVVVSKGESSYISVSFVRQSHKEPYIGSLKYSGGGNTINIRMKDDTVYVGGTYFCRITIVESISLFIPFY